MKKERRDTQTEVIIRYTLNTEEYQAIRDQDLLAAHDLYIRAVTEENPSPLLQAGDVAGAEYRFRKPDEYSEEYETPREDIEKYNATEYQLHNNLLQACNEAGIEIEEL